MVEKPLAPTAETTERLLALAAEHGVAVCPVHQYLYQSGVVRAARLLAQLGTLRQVDAFACSAGAEGGGDAARDAVALDILIHPLSLLRRLVTPEVAVLEWHVRRTAPGELRAVAAAAGAAIGIVVSTHGRPTHHTLRLVADAGTLHLDLFHGFCVAESGAVSRGRKVARPFALGSAMVARASANLLQRAARREPAYPGLREIIGRFYVAVAGGGPVPVPPEETVDVARARDMIAAVLPVRGALP
jgi:predicted dehydrogenase